MPALSGAPCSPAPARAWGHCGICQSGAPAGSWYASGTTTCITPSACRHSTGGSWKPAATSASSPTSCTGSATRNRVLLGRLERRALAHEPHPGQRAEPAGHDARFPGARPSVWSRFPAASGPRGSSRDSRCHNCIRTALIQSATAIPTGSPRHPVPRPWS